MEPRSARAATMGVDGATVRDGAAHDVTAGLGMSLR